MNMQIDSKLDSIPNNLYNKFFDKFKEINNLPIESWSKVHIIGYFCSKYKIFYNVDYKFKFNTSAPSKCFEMFQAGKLAMLLSSNPQILKQYIDWIFDYKIKQAKRRITSISFITAEDTINDYKINVLLKENEKIDRTTQLPANYMEAFNGTSFSPKTYGDLAFILQVPNLPDAVKESFIALRKMGFEQDILEKIV